MTSTNNKKTGPHYPEVEVSLIGGDGNAFVILGKVQRALKQAGVGEVEVNRFHQEATSGDYDHLLRTCMKWVSVN